MEVQTAKISKGHLKKKKKEVLYNLPFIKTTLIKIVLLQRWTNGKNRVQRHIHINRDLQVCHCHTISFFKKALNQSYIPKTKLLT